MNRFFPNIILSILIVWSILSMYNYVGIFQNLISPNIVTATSILTYLIESIAIYLVATKFNIFFKSSLCKTVIFWLLYTSIICLFTSELFYFDIREVLWFPSIFIIFYYIGITDNKTNNNIKHIFKYTLLILLPINLLLYELILSLPYFSLSGNYASSNQIFYIILLIPYLPYVKSKFFKYILFGIISIATLYSFKRSALICVIIILLLSLYFDFLKRKSISSFKYIPFVFVIIFLAYNTFIDVNKETDGHITNRIESTEEDKGSGRLDIWEIVLNKSFNTDFSKLPFGHGHNGVIKSNIVHETAGNSSEALSAHNDFIEILYDFGLLGFFIYLTYTIKVLSLRKKISKTNYSILYQSVCFANVLFIVLSFVSHLVLYPTYYAYLLIVFAISTGKLNQIKYDRNKYYSSMFQSRKYDKTMH